MDTNADTGGGGNWLFDRLPRHVLDGLSEDQRRAFTDAIAGPPWSAHPVNIRLSLPFVRRRVYVTVVGGGEKRTGTRRAQDRGRHPLATVANVLFVFGIATLFYSALLVALAVYSALIEF